MPGRDLAGAAPVVLAVSAAAMAATARVNDGAARFGSAWNPLSHPSDVGHRNGVGGRISYTYRRICVANLFVFVPTGDRNLTTSSGPLSDADVAGMMVVRLARDCDALIKPNPCSAFITAVLGVMLATVFSMARGDVGADPLAVPFVMFPTIFTLGIKGLGRYTRKHRACIMAIAGGARVVGGRPFLPMVLATGFVPLTAAGTTSCSMRCGDRSRRASSLRYPREADLLSKSVSHGHLLSD